MSYIPDFGVCIKVQGPKGDVEYRSLSRQLVMFCVERRKAWRMLQSKAGIENKEYKAQRGILADVAAGKIAREDFFARAEELLQAKLSVMEVVHTPAPAPAVAAKKPAVAPEIAKKPPASEPARVAVVVATQVTKASTVENEPPDWEQRIQVRLMELDVDPGNDADPRLSKGPGQ